MRIRALGFDFDHTLGIDNKLERVAFLRLLEVACASGGRRLGTLAEEIEQIDALLVRQRSGEFTIEHAVETFVSERGQSDPRALVTMYKQMAAEMVDAFVIPQIGIGQMLAAIAARGLPCAILTNGWSPLQQRKAQRVGFPGPVLVSADIGAQKPSRAAFDALSATLGVAAAEIAFVGDTPASDVGGALDAGMHAIWLDAEGARYPEDVPAPTAVIHSLAEIEALL